MSLEGIAELKLRYRDSFRAAESALKRFERIGAKTLLSSINQLRYAACHYIDGEYAESEDDARESLTKAVNHCQRAEYDAVDASIVMLGKSITTFNGKYAIASVLKAVPDYAEAYAKAVRALAILRSGISSRAKDIKREDCEKRNAALDDLLSFWDDVLVKIPLVEKVEEERIAAKRTAYRQWIIGMVIAVLTLAVTLVIGLR